MAKINHFFKFTKELPMEYAVELNRLIELSIDRKKLVGIISTHNPDGYPHSVPIWISLVDSRLYFSIYKSSQKAKNIERNPKSGLTIVDTPGGPYIHLLVTGQIRKKEEFERYEKIVGILMTKYVPEEQVEQFTSDRMENPERILIELQIDRVLVNPFVSKNPDADDK